MIVYKLNKSFYSFCLFFSKLIKKNNNDKGKVNKE